jgi:hypothetical protein
MIDLFFQFGNEFILVKVDGSNVRFGSSEQGSQLATIDGLKLDYLGVVKEFPDLEDNPGWKRIATERFKENIKRMNNEDEVSNYIINDLKKYGYIPKLKQRKGFRVEKI